MVNKIPKKIKSVRIAPDKDSKPQEKPTTLARPDRGYRLNGTTYKVKTPDCDAAYYFTINDKVIDGKLHPWEIFCNSKDVTHFQWVTALTRTVSAIFRLSPNLEFLIEELASVVDPKGGFFEGGRYVPSLAAKIGLIIKEHIDGLECQTGVDINELSVTTEDKPKSSIQCKNPACMQFSVVIKDGCKTCLDCGDSACG